MRTGTTRTQRRMERKQAMLLLLMVLAVALVSFALGVMVGRSGTDDVAKSDSGSKEVVKKLPAPDPVTADEETSGGADSNLTFYEMLPKSEKSPMGSGINLPPEQRKEPTEVEAAQKTIAGKKTSKDTEETTATETVTPPSTASVEVGGTFSLQVASFKKIKSALALQEKLHKKGYPAQVREVDLGEKGVWSRVIVGPFEARSKAQETLERLEDREGLSPMIREG